MIVNQLMMELVSRKNAGKEPKQGLVRRVGLTQALHSVLGPIGPLLHSGVSVAPQPKHVGGGPFFLSPEFPLFLPAMVFPDRAPVLPAEPLLPCFPFPILTPFPWLALFEVGLT